MRLDDKRIILTGAASGIGLATLKRLTARDVKIIAVDINADELETACDALASFRSEIIPYPCDLTQNASVDALFEFALESWGGVDIFIANAGFAYYEKIQQPDWAHIERIYQLNVFSPIYAALKMREINPERPYRMLMTASAMGLLAIPGYAIYGSTKAALDRFAEGYRYELADPASLSLIYPIGTRTSFFEAASPGAAPPPWPSQTADDVSRAIIHGIEHDQKSIYPSRFFRVFITLDRIFPFLRRIEQRLENRRLRKWLQQQPERLLRRTTESA